MVERLMADEPTTARPVIRLRVVGVFAGALFAIMFIRLWSLQVLDNSAYTAAVNQNQVRAVQVQAPRGLILDRSGATIVGNTVSRNILLSQQAAVQYPAVVGNLAALLGITPSAIQTDFADSENSQYDPVTILANAPMSDVLYIGEHASEFPGVTTSATSERSYPLGTAGAQVVGDVGDASAAQLKAGKGEGLQLGDQIGQAGLDEEYDPFLRGKAGEQQLEVDARDQVVGTLGQTSPVPGDDLVTNIDAGLEQTLQTSLDNELLADRKTIDASTGRVPPAPDGAAIVIDPQNGAVLAMVSAPTYNPTIWNGGISTTNWAALNAPSAHDPIVNRAIDGTYIPGSTFKLATATAALKDGLISPDSYIDDPGSFTVPNCTGMCKFVDNDNEQQGPITISTALTVSSDVFFYTLGYDFWVDRGTYGATAIQDVASDYGYGSKTGIDLPGEAQGIVDSLAERQKLHTAYPTAYPNPPAWYVADNIEMAFGQGGTSITPIEEAEAYATFANGGTRYQPEIAAGFVTPGGKVVKAVKPIVTGHVDLSASDRAAMLAGYEGVVSDPNGTATSVFAGFPMNQMQLAGKTGTASQNGEVPTAWFVGWGPVSDPQYLIVVVVDQGGYGADAAAPVARDGFNYLLANPISPVQMTVPTAPSSSAGGKSSATAFRSSGTRSHPGPSPHPVARSSRPGA
jgi:penicillin-binding protein 2